jgi:hypothetical protein
MPPPSLSERYALEEEEGEGRILSQQPNDDLSIQQYDDDVDDEEEEYEEEESSENLLSTSYKDEDKTKNSLKDLIRRHSISSFTQKSSPTSSTTTAVSSSSSPPQLSNTDHELWKATLEKLKQTLFVASPPLSPPPVPAPSVKKTNTKKKKATNKLIPMPIPPRRPLSQKRRSEATTQPRFNPDTNTYTRDTRSNPDHLRMISAELNMMRGRKLLSPLKPRGFLPRRKDAFIRGEQRKPSHLMNEIK